MRYLITVNNGGLQDVEIWSTSDSGALEENIRDCVEEFNEELEDHRIEVWELTPIKVAIPTVVEILNLPKATKPTTRSRKKKK